MLPRVRAEQCRNVVHHRRLQPSASRERMRKICSKPAGSNGESPQHSRLCANDQPTPALGCRYAAVRNSGVQEAVQKAVQKAEADKQYREAHRHIIEAEKKKAAKQKADTAAQACAQFSKEPKCGQDFAQSSYQPTKLPPAVWRSIQNTLHADIPWDQVVSNPLSLKHAVLTKACKSVGEQSSGTKAVLVLRLLKFFGVDRPCAVPAIVLLALKHEKNLLPSPTNLPAVEPAH